MRPRPKIYQPNLVSLASLTLAFFGLIFTFCYIYPSYASASLFRSTFWWGPLLAVLALADCGIEKFADQKSKTYGILAFSVSGLQFLFLLIFVYRYFAIDGTSGGTYLAPRIGAVLALFALAGVSVYVKTLRLHASPMLSNPLVYSSLLGLIAGFGLVAFALMVWSIDVSQERAWGGEFYPVFITLLAGVAEIGDSLYVFESKEKPLEEQELKTRMIISFAGAASALVAIFMAVGFYDASWLSLILFYWTLFPSVGLCLLSLGAGAYYAYVSYRLKN